MFRLRIAFALALFAVNVFSAVARADDEVEFARDVEPILQSRCVRCHGPTKQESGFRVDMRKAWLKGGDLGEPALTPGKVNESRLIELVSGADPDLRMPPEGERLTKKQIDVLKRWIAQGARMPEMFQADRARLGVDHWSLQPLQPVVPPKTDDGFVINPIDAFILRRLRSLGLQPSPPADRATLIRRLMLVMHGLPPTPEQVKKFVDDADERAYEKLVARTLESPRYGERWARHWLDIVRFGETHGFETNRERPNAYHYRDYVIDALNSDKPYDQFVKEQIAGDALGVDAATGFLVAGPYDLVKSPDVNLTLMQRQDELADIVNTTGATFLGLSIGCARCHDHKFDPITQSDFYAIQAVFAGVRHGDRPLTASPSTERHRERIRDDLRKQRTRLADLIPPTRPGAFLLIDDSHEASTGGRGVEYLSKPAGVAKYVAGADRGALDDPGGPRRLPNISGGSYRWWKNKPRRFVAVYRPWARGRFRIWLSWGSGSASHSSDAEYVLDRDGDLKTVDDQTVLAQTDQRRFADGAGEAANRKLWSGLRLAGEHSLSPRAAIAVRGGNSGDAVTTDLLALEAVGESTLPAPTKPDLRPPLNTVRNLESFPPTKAKFVRFTVHATSGSQPCIDELEIWSGDTNVALASAGGKATCSSTLPGYAIHQLKHINDGKYGNSHSWISNETGGGWVQIEFPQTVEIDRIVWGRDREKKYADRLATRYEIAAAVEEGKWSPLVDEKGRLPVGALAPAPIAYDQKLAGNETAAGRQLKRLREGEREYVRLSQKPQAYAGTFSQPGPTHRLYRGEPLAKREVVAPDTIGLLGSLQLKVDEPEQKRRLKFADWLVDAKNPLTPRVLVNRLWQHHFGRGIVATPSDFGANGVPPSHPELLDWLARRAIDAKWSLKRLHYLILTSNTFRQSSAPRALGLAKDADCRLLWRFPPRRLEAEAIRDCTLQVAGVLDLKMGGPGFSAFEVQLENVRHYFSKKSFGPADWRRMVYMTKVRQEQDAVFGAFDCPDASQVMPKRSRSTTPLQALNLFNSRFIVQQTELFAARLKREAGESPEGRIRRAFALCFNRLPEKQELEAAAALMREHGGAALCRALLNSSEFLFIP